MTTHLSSLHLYPVKSCAGISVPEVELDRFGPVGYRRWMLVDRAGDFLTQRTLPGMALVRVEPGEGGGLRLVHQGASLDVDVPGPEAPRAEVRVWSEQVPAADAGDRVAAWLSARLQRPCRLVYMPDDTRRRVDPDYARRQETVGFADGFPLLLISAASLAALNARLTEPVSMNRFRPNLVVSGCDAFAEDQWRRIRIGDVELDVAKPCGRCVIPAIDQASARRNPIVTRTLASFRRLDGQVLFGQNLLYAQPEVGRAGRLAVGDELVVLA